MAVTISEAGLQHLRNATQKKIPKSYILKGITGQSPFVNEEDEALQSIHAATATSVLNLTRQDDQTTVEEITQLADGTSIYLATVVWSDEKKEDEPGDCSFSFNISGQTTHISHSLETVETYFPPDEVDAPDHHNAINVRRDGGKPVIDGVDVIVPAFSFSIGKVFEDTFVSASYVNQVFQRVGSVNDSQYQVKGFTFAAGELLLTGASGGESKDGEVTLTFDFSALENASGLSVDDIEGINKDGHDYLWVATETIEDEDNDALVESARAVYVERIYPRKDFSVLSLCET